MNESYSAWREKRGRKTEIGVNLKNNISTNQVSRMLLKCLVKQLAFQRLRDLLNSGMKKKVFGTFYRATERSGKKRKKSVGRILEKLEMASNESFP